jgi:hypothetical protein
VSGFKNFKIIRDTNFKSTQKTTPGERAMLSHV